MLEWVVDADVGDELIIETDWDVKRLSHLGGSGA